jgi:hypothetical protein
MPEVASEVAVARSWGGIHCEHNIDEKLSDGLAQT